MAAQSRFISRLGERALPLFKLLKCSGPFVWTEDADQALSQLKAYLTSPPILVAPGPEEPLLLYLAATPQAVSAPLVVECDEDHPQTTSDEPDHGKELGAPLTGDGPSSPDGPSLNAPGP